MRILIADDHGVLRAGLRALLQGVAGLEVVGEAAGGLEVLQLAERLQPDLVLLDISLPGLDGVEVARRLREQSPTLQILIMTMHEDVELVREAMRAGASGYLIKRAVESELLTAIQAVRRGELYVHPALTRGLFAQPQPAVAPQAAHEALTPRELHVLRLIAEGYTNRQIAETLALSVRTVESHRAAIMDKLALRTRAELAHYAAERGLLRMPGPS